MENKSKDFALLKMAWDNKPRRLVTIEQLRKFVEGGRITEAEFEEITGEEYAP